MTAPARPCRTVTVDLNLDDYLAIRNALEDRAEHALSRAKELAGADPRLVAGARRYACQHAVATDLLARLDVVWFAASRVGA